MMLDRVPLHRFCTPEEVAGAVSYLVSAKAAYITGHTLFLDGGLTAAYRGRRAKAGAVA